MLVKMEKVTDKNIEVLQQISIETFSDTFGSENSKEDLDNYLKTAYGYQKLKNEVSNPDTEFQLIYYDDKLSGYIKINVGHAQTELKEDAGLEIERIYIRKPFHRFGLGKYLVNYVFNKAQELNKDYVWLGVWEHNEGAITFYHKQGFFAFNEHIFNLGGDIQRDILMKKEL
jgi:ribosomal protein S18 acetylase RimI-like enzyme